MAIVSLRIADRAIDRTTVETAALFALQHEDRPGPAALKALAQLCRSPNSAIRIAAERLEQQWSQQ